ncbi:hypothetical protein ACO0QE_002528 [Hanseniaspora vineae]
MSTYPVITIKPSYNSIVRGCPGVPETLPRIECELRVRSNNGKPFVIDRIELFLKTIETVNSHVPHVSSPALSFHSPISHSPFSNSPLPSSSKSLPSTPFSTSSFPSFPTSSNNLQKKNSRTHSTTGPSPGKATTNLDKHTSVTLSYKKKLRINSDSLPDAKEIIGIDVPITIGLPDDIKATNFNEVFGRTYTVMEACVFYQVSSKSLSKSTSEKVHKRKSDSYLKKRSSLKEDLKSYEQNTAFLSSELAMVQFETPIIIDRYDIYPSAKLFPPVKYKESSPDGKLDIVYRLNGTCFGTDDLLRLDLDIKHNVNATTPHGTSSSLVFVGQKKKLKVKEITLEVKELLENTNTSTGLVETKDNVLCSTTKTINEHILNNSIQTRIDLRLITINKFFQSYERTLLSPEVMFKLPEDDPMASASVTPPSIVFLQNKKKTGAEPLQYHSSVTTRGPHYNVTHYIVVKFKCSGILKSFEWSHPITLSYWCKPQVRYLDDIIDEEKEVARNAKNFYDKFGGIKRVHRKEGILEYPPLPPIIFPYDNDTLETLGVFHEIKGSKKVRVPVIE